jgi:hypothetical protein
MAENKKPHKKQHYVPKFYLKLFSQDGKHLGIYNLKSKESFQVPIKNLCYEKYFYTKNSEFEKALSLIEQKQAETLHKLVNAQDFANFGHEDFYFIRSFLLLQSSRTKDEKVILNKYGEFFVANFVKPLMKSSEDLKRKGLTEDVIDNIKITFPTDHILAMSVALREVELLSDLEPILIINKSNRNFICSDAPIVLYNYIKIENTNTTGYQFPGLQIFCPLNKNILLLLIDKNLYDLKRGTGSTIFITRNSDVDSINKLQLVNCLDNVFFSKEDDTNYVRKLHSEVEDLIKEREFRSDIVQTTQNNDGTYSEIVTLYQADSNYVLKLSSIKLNKKNKRLFEYKYKKLSMSSKPFYLCRNEELVDRSNRFDDLFKKLE